MSFSDELEKHRRFVGGVAGCSVVERAEDGKLHTNFLLVAPPGQKTIAVPEDRIDPYSAQKMLADRDRERMRPGGPYEDRQRTIHCSPENMLN